MSERDQIWAAWNDAVGFAADSIRGGTHAHATARWIAEHLAPEMWQIVEIKIEKVTPAVPCCAICRAREQPDPISSGGDE